MPPQRSEGFVPVLGYRLYYRTFGRADLGSTLLALHGGPGACHDYLLPLADLAEAGYRVVFFDHLGCGRSEVPTDPSLFTLEHHVREVEGIRSALGLGRVHLLGSSYGGLLAIAYALAHPDRLKSLTTVGGLASVPFAQAEMNRLKAVLPADTLATMQRCEAEGRWDAPEYQEAVRVFYLRHLCRLDPWPRELTYALEQAATHPVYRTMNGPNEFTITGTIRDIDLTPRLGEIHVPTLVLGGRYDEVTPAVARQIHLGIPGSKSVMFDASSHLPFWEERDRFFGVLTGFLRSVDRTDRTLAGMRAHQI
ncbi:MAG: proline iminopeptidase-family hydrolase [Thermoplasmata archaeon]